jgi:hypothetical protein
MAVTSTGKRSKATLVKKEMVEEANSFLQDLPEKQKEDLSLKEAVNKLREPIQEALAKGYSYPDLAKMLSEKGIKISALTLKNYAPSGRKQSSKAKPRRAKKVQSSSVASVESLLDNSDSSEAEAPAPKSRRGGGRTTASRSSAAKSTAAKTPRRTASTAKTGAKSTSTTRRRKASAE